MNVLIGLWIIAAPWLGEGSPTAAVANNLVAGAGIILLSLPKGPVRETYADWGSWVR